MARAPLSASPATQATPISTGVPVQFDLPPMNLTPFIEGRMNIGWEAPPTIGIRATPVATPAATIPPPRPFTETGIPARQESELPTWVWPALSLFAIIGVLGAYIWTNSPAKAPPAPVASPPVQTTPAVPRQSNAVAQTLTGIECTQVKVNSCITRTQSSYIQITPRGTRVNYPLISCIEMNDSQKGNFMRCESVGVSEIVNGNELRKRDFRHYDNDSRMAVAASRLSP